MSYELHHGDCLDVLPTIAPQSIDAVIADIPSGRTACAWDSVIPFEPMWEQLKRVTKPRGAIVLLGCTQPFTSALIMSNPAMFKHTLIWNKRFSGAFANAKKLPMQIHEDICIFGIGAVRYYPQMIARSTPIKSGGMSQSSTMRAHGFVPLGKSYSEKYPISILDYPRMLGNTTHPTQKPQALLEYLVKTYTNPGDTVLDFCYGSGTTGHACGNLGRRFIGMERDAGYFAAGAERIASAYAPLRAMEAAI